ncbi:coiled-coil domain-containing protein 83 [Gadus chalcogrammus]|uniref:coiled-coil domain-containing protein 83 n=1 Tax=Gadus chalcogrammus TaxID=1042646 RepID=UPI0024C25BE0|nr:coiled-coil domain-containing protein 83 [Gadus chalcogrammus]XP_056450108.1 coiled-coil domain-containing protein 83 [Gadus chalcogrammus]XP_056450109.1 coiled-coil domain-containing protein 83 [Gadus chalcogrammus]
MSEPSVDEKNTPAKSYIEFRVQLKRKDIQDLLGEIDQLETKKLRNVKLLQQLKSEQDNQMRLLLKQVKEQEKKLAQKELAHLKQLEQDKDAALSKTAEVEDVQRGLSDVERQVSERLAQCQELRDYRDRGVHQHQAQITQLEEERERMQLDAAAAAEHIKSQLSLTLRMIEMGTGQAIKDNRLAEEMKNNELNMDESQRAAHRDNEWLREKVSAYREEVSALELSVQGMEEENVGHCDWLFDQRLKRLSISRPGSKPGSDLRESTILNPTSVAGCGAAAASDRLEGDEIDSSCIGSATPDQLRPRHNLSVGELQQRLLTVVGQTVPLHLPPTEDHRWDGGMTYSSTEVASKPLTIRQL